MSDDGSEWEQRQSDRVRDDLASAILNLDANILESLDETDPILLNSTIEPKSPPMEKSRFGSGVENLQQQDIRCFIETKKNENTGKKTNRQVYLIFLLLKECGFTLVIKFDFINFHCLKYFGPE